MVHFILFLYLLCGFSGVSSLIYLTGKYGKTSHRLKGYIRIHIIYTTMMLTALAILYLRVNVLNSPWLMPLFISSILAGQGFLLHALFRFSLMVNQEEIPRKTQLFWKLFPILYYLLAIVQLFVWFTPYTLLPVLIGVPLFIGASIWFSIQNNLVKEYKDPELNKLWMLFILFTLAVIAFEFILRSLTSFPGDYSLNIPIIFLAWNSLNLYQFKVENGKYSSTPLPFQIDREKADQWQLTSREQEITQAVLDGRSNKEIASDLSISTSTVKNHIYNIYRKTGAQSRVELVNLFR